MLGIEYGHLQLLTAVCTVCFAGLGAFDGLWLHLWRYRLHQRARSEHRLHTVRAVLMPAQILFFVMNSSTGFWLWLGTLVVLVDMAVVVWDAAIERASRSFQGGLPSGEAGLHQVLQSLHVAMLVCAAFTHPWAAWGFTPVVPPPTDPLAHLILTGVLWGSLGYAALHLWLCFRPGHGETRSALAA